MAIHSEPDPILRVTIGSPVYTQNDERIGTVKELRGRAFKVGTPFLRRDFWLDADCVASAVPDAAVYLMVDKRGVEGRKLKAPPSA